MRRHFGFSAGGAFAPPFAGFRSGVSRGGIHCPRSGFRELQDKRSSAARRQSGAEIRKAGISKGRKDNRPKPGMAVSLDAHSATSWLTVLPGGGGRNVPNGRRRGLHVLHVLHGFSAGTRQGGGSRHVADLRVRRRGGGVAGIRPCHFANIAAANSDLRPWCAFIAVPPFPLRGRVGPKGIRS